MCGIAGIIGNNQSVSIEKMLNRIAHRGPNGLFYWKSEKVALGHARLSIIDLTTAANQPMVDPATGNVIVFNGEIYNYLEIKKEIGSRYQFQTASDTEVILAAYQVYGIDFLEKLRGMFAFALYDAHQHKTLISRDRFGIKPFYYRQQNGAFYFASEIKSLIYLDQSAEQIQHQKAYEFIANCQLDTDTSTLFDGVNQLLPARYAWVDETGKMSAPVEYWHFPEPGNLVYRKSDAEDLVGLFDETIRLHMRSDVTLGSFFSGGLDSSAVSFFMSKNLTHQPMHTFSAVLPYHHPENALIPQTLKSHPDWISHQFLLSGQDFFKDIPALIYHHDEPVMDGSMYAHYKLCEISNQADVRVLLSGSGGDELFGGYASHIHSQHSKLLSQFRFVSYWKELRESSGHSGMSVKKLLVKSLYEQLPIAVRKRIKLNQIRKKIQHLNIAPDFPHYYHPHKDSFFETLINNYRSWTAPPFLHYEDRNSMAFGIETRVPFFDHKLIEGVLKYRTEDIMKGRSKNLMRNAFRNMVPDPILDQKGKYGFPSPIDHALREDEQGKALFYGLISQTPILDEKATRRLGDEFYQSNGDVSIFWRTLSFMIWHDLFFKHKNQYLKD